MGMFRYLALLLVLCPVLGASAPILRAAQPALSPDGKTLLFVWQGDIWTVSVEGGQAQRLTIHPATDQQPHWSPDGKSIVFCSDRYGNTNLFSLRRDGTGLLRLTFDSGYQYPNAFSPDGKFIYGTTNSFGGQDIFRVSATGGDLIRLTSHPMEREFHASVSPQGTRIALCVGGGSGNWRKPGLKGSLTSDIWIADNTVPLSQYRNITNSDWNNAFPTFAEDGSITFVSNRSGWPNLWRMKSDGTGMKQLTRHSDGTVRYPTLDSAGKQAVYEFESELWKLDTASGKGSRLLIEVADDQRTNPESELTHTSGVTGYAIAPNSKRIVLVIRGDLFLIPERGGTTKQLTTHPANDEQPVWIDARTILFVTGRNGHRELMTVDVDGKEKLFLSDRLDLVSPQLAPDGKTLAFHRGMREIVVMPVTGGTPKAVFIGAFGDALRGGTSFSWSPDSAWLAIDAPTDRGSRLVLKEVASGREIVGAQLARGISGTPRFLPNGKGVYFSAAEYENSDLFVVDLIPAEITFSEDDLEKIDTPRGTKTTPVRVEIDAYGIEDRMRRLSSEGAFGALASADSRTIWANVKGQLVAIAVASGTSTPVQGLTGTAGDLQLSPDGQRLMYISSGRLYSLTPGQPAPQPISFSANQRIQWKAEQAALFAEIVWAMDRMYYDPKLNNKNWSAIRQKFAKIVPHAYDRSDFYALMGEMMEELDSSHLGAGGPSDPSPGESQNVGWLGIEVDPRALATRGQFVISDVLKGTPADHPQSRLSEGDRILQVDGIAPGADAPLSSLLIRKVGKKTVVRISRNGKEMDVAIKPIDSQGRSSANYQNWLQWQRDQVEKLSGGEFAYLHIQGMNEPSYELFLRQIRTLALGKKGVVIDVRYNGGGSTAQKILGVLIKTPWLIRTNRAAPEVALSENIYRGDSLEIPSVLLINSSSFSNAEIFAEGFRRLKIGPVVGERTAGGVIGTSSYGLWDGGQIRMPSGGAYTIDGENLEGNGRHPDIAVPHDPNAWDLGRDTMLEAAVEALKKRTR